MIFSWIWGQPPFMTHCWYAKDRSYGNVLGKALPCRNGYGASFNFSTASLSIWQ